LKKFAEEMESTKHSKRQKFKNVLKLFGFVFLMVIFITLLVIYQTNFGANHNLWQASLREWAEYLAFGQISGFVFNLAARQSPTLIILVVFGICSPGFVMFFLYFVFQTDVVQLWVGFLHFRLGLSCCKRFAKEDTITGTDSGATGSSHGSSGSAGSNDIFGSVETLNHKKSHTLSESAVTQTVVMSSFDDGNKLSGQIIAPPLPVSYARGSREKRNTLFKGFSQPAKGRKTRSPSSPPQSYVSEADCDPPNSGVEMVQMGLIMEILEDEDEGKIE